MRENQLRPWEITRLTIPQARLYFDDPEPQETTAPSDSIQAEAWRLRTRIFDLMCSKRRVSPKELSAIPDAELLTLYADCAKGIAQQTDVAISKLRERLAEYITDKANGITV